MVMTERKPEAEVKKEEEKRERKRDRRGAIKTYIREGDYLKVMIGRMFLYLKVLELYDYYIVAEDILGNVLTLNLLKASFWGKIDEQTFNTKREMIRRRKELLEGEKK